MACPRHINTFNTYKNVFIFISLHFKDNYLFYLSYIYFQFYIIPVLNLFVPEYKWLLSNILEASKQGIFSRSPCQD